MTQAERREVWLCLSGGNALGAYHAGVYKTLHDAGIEVSRISGTSVGAIVGAIIAGNAFEDRPRKLDEFWQLATEKFTIANLYPDIASTKIAAGLGTLLFGRPGLFHPASSQWFRRLLGLTSKSLLEREGLRENLTRLVDFDRLNSGPVRFMANAVDIRSGEHVIFDSASERITVDHLMASSAFPVLFPPQRIGERDFADGGLVANLPLQPLFRDMPEGSVTCLAFDLFPMAGNGPDTLDDTLRRAQQLLLSWQSRRALDVLELEFRDRSDPLRILYACYAGANEVGAMTLEFSADSMRRRYDAGRHDGARCVQRIEADGGEPGLRIERLPEVPPDGEKRP